MEHKLSQGLKVQTNFRVRGKAEWSAVSVLRILTNEVYTGVLLQGKTTTPNYKVKKRLERPEAEWIRVEDAHEALVCREAFGSVQELLKKDTRISPERDTLYALSGYVYCGGCGQAMVRKSVKRNGKRYSYYICSTHKAGRGCGVYGIREEKLEKTVLCAIQNQIRAAADMERILRLADSLPEEQRDVRNYDLQMVKLREDMERSREFKMKLYESLQDGMIDQEEYFAFRKNYEDRIGKAQAALDVLEKERRAALDGGRKDLAWLERFAAYGSLEELDRAAVTEFLEAVQVHDGQTVEVVFRFADQWEEAEEMIGRMSGKGA